MNGFTKFELSILEAIQNMRSPGLDKFMVDITSLGNGAILWICLILVFLSTKEYKKMAKIIIVAFIANLVIINLGLKNIVGRTRPYEYIRGFDLLIPKVGNASFPSGHSSYAATFATIVLFMGRSKFLKIFITILAILISFSRLYLHVHFPSDVISGIIFGIIIAIFSMKFYFAGYFDKIKFNLQGK